MTRSKFPEGVDQFEELFDLPYNKVLEAQRLTELKMKPSLTNDEQNEMLTLTTSLKEYLITPETFNKFQDCLQNVEQFFYSEVFDFLKNKQVTWENYIRQFQVFGKWQAGKNYKMHNLVYEEDGTLFLCLKDHVSVAEKSPQKAPELWQQMTARGEKGDIGLNAIYKGIWNKETAYKLGDVVTLRRVNDLDRVEYLCLRDNVGKTPDESPDDWQLYSRLVVSKTEPKNVGEGAHFIKLIE